jgi:anti-sigma factor RsiW
MNKIDPCEISGLLDGELSPERAAEVQAFIEADASARAEYQRLLRLHGVWSEAAASAVFQPRVRLNRAASPRVAVTVALGLVALLAARFLPKFVLPLGGIAVQGFVLLAVVAWLVVESVGRNARVNRSTGQPINRLTDRPIDRFT